MHPAPDRDHPFYRRQSFWLDSLDDSLTPRPALEGECQADVVIIGAGYTGLWTAWYLKEQVPQLNVVVLESEIAGYGASGRNGGWCSAYLAGIDALAANPATRSGARQLQRLMIETVGEIGRVAAAEDIDCHYERSGHVAVAVTPAHRQRARERVAEMRRLGMDEQDCRVLDAGEVQAHIQVEGALGGYAMAHCAAIHPARLVRGLADALERRGVRIFERSPVTGWSGSRVQTDRGSVRAGRLLIATEGYSGSLPALRRKLIPIHSMMVATEPLDPEQKACTGLSRRIAFNNLKHMVTYGQMTADGRIAFGCRGRYRFGSRLFERFEAASPAFDIVRGELLKFFPALKGVRFTHAWGGALGVSRQMAPAVCFDHRASLGWAGGYLGDGVTAAALAGRTLAELTLDQDTERTRALWVNPRPCHGLKAGRWEHEPLRWLGIQSIARMKHWADRAELSDSPLAPLILRLVDALLP